MPAIVPADFFHIVRGSPPSAMDLPNASDARAPQRLLDAIAHIAPTQPGSLLDDFDASAETLSVAA